MSLAKRPSSARILNRRTFLRCSLAGAIAPAIIPATALGLNGAVAPSNRITLGQVGFGWIGGAHLSGFLANQRVQFLCACDCYRERRERVTNIINEHYSGKVCTPYHSFEDMLARDDLDVVVIAVPDHWHAAIAIEAAKAGKDIYCEKPLSLTIRQGRAIVDAARRYGRVFQTGSQQRSEFSGHFIRAAELVRNGRIGKVQSISVNTGGPPRPFDMQPEPIPDGLDWDRWLGPAPELPYHSMCCPGVDWRSFREFCGGGFADMGAHHFDIAQWALGMDESGPVEVRPPDGKELTRLTYRYANGVTMDHGGEIDCDFRGTEGRIMATREYLRAEPESILQEPLGPNDVHLDRHRGHHDDWLDCVLSRGRPVADVEIGHRSATVCHLGNIAYQLKRPLRWDPKNERFLDDACANRFLDRSMRSPWRL